MKATNQHLAELKSATAKLNDAVAKAEKEGVGAVPWATIFQVVMQILSLLSQFFPTPTPVPPTK